MNSDSCLFFARSTSAAVGPSFARRAISPVTIDSISASELPGRAVACTTNRPAISPDELNALTAVAICLSYTSARVSRAESPSARMRAVRSSVASSGVKYSGTGQPRYTRSSETRSFTSTTFSPSTGGIHLAGRSSAGPGGISPKYFSTSFFASAGSKSPAMTSERLFGV